jgi:hypothetical protein
MPSINDMIKNLGSKSDRSELKDMALRLKLQIEDGTMSIEEARKELQRFKDNQSYRASKGMADGGDVKKGIGSFLPRMSNGGILNSLSELMRALIFVESRGNPNAVSEAGAIGLTQVKVPTAMQPGYNVDTIFEIARKNDVDFSGETAEEAERLLFIPSLNVQFGEQYLQAMIKRFGNVNDGILAYNQGAGTVGEFIEKGRDPSILSQEGRDYLPKVLQAVGVEDFGFENIPPVALEEQRTLGSVLPESLSMAGQEFLKSEDPINPVYTTVPQARPTELVDKLGLPGDIIRDAEIPMDRPEDLSDYPTKLMEAFKTQENEKSLDELLRETLRAYPDFKPQENEKSLDELLRETQIRKPYTFMDDTIG